LCNPADKQTIAYENITSLIDEAYSVSLPSVAYVCKLNDLTHMPVEAVHEVGLRGVNLFFF